MAITADAVKELRELTGAGIMDSKRALEETGGDLDKAVALLRERGVAAAEKKSGREAREGLVSSYIHTGGRIGVLVEVNCETDFVARTEQFQTLVRNIAIQVAGLRPLYVSAAESIPAEELEAKKADLLADQSDPGRPENVRDKIVEGQLKKWLADVVRSSSSPTATPTRASRTSSPTPSPRSARTSASVAAVRFELGEDA